MQILHYKRISLGIAWWNLAPTSWPRLEGTGKENENENENGKENEILKGNAN